MKLNKDKKTILLVEDDRNTREGVSRLLRSKYDITLAEDGLRGKNILDRNDYDIVITDIRMPGADGMDILKKTQEKDPPPPCILITAYGSIETAVEAIKAGAYDFISKPINLERLEQVIERALEAKNLKEENITLRKQLNKTYGLENIIGKSKKMSELFDMVRQIAPAKSTVLITGESGTGKELIAQSIHQLSGRKGAFVPVHCAALPAALLESELFGHEKGAFTGATELRAGRFETAGGGTIFLDEIGEIDQSVQVKLLRVIETKTFERVGGSIPITSDVRIVAATNKNLPEMVQKGEFREDLFYRLNVLNVELPPLRERKDDLPLLINSFIGQFSEENGKLLDGITDTAMSLLYAYDWPGNIRELRNCIERMVVLCRGNILDTIDIPVNIRNIISPDSPRSFIQTTDTLNIETNEKRLVLQALQETNGNKTLAAEKLGISRRTLHRKLNEYGIH